MVRKRMPATRVKGVRLPAELWDEIEGAAAERGVSANAEIARRVESYSGTEVPLRWLCNSVGMDTKDLAWYFENGYFANLSLDLNQKMVRRRTVPRYDPNRS